VVLIRGAKAPRSLQNAKQATAKRGFPSGMTSKRDNGKSNGYGKSEIQILELRSRMTALVVG
jgi:hypothetical protein